MFLAHFKFFTKAFKDSTAAILQPKAILDLPTKHNCSIFILNVRDNGVIAL